MPNRIIRLSVLAPVVFVVGLATTACLAQVTYPPGTPTLGARFDAEGDDVTFRIYSKRAERIELYLFDTPQGADEKAHHNMTKGAGDVWEIKLPLSGIRANGIAGDVYYGYRAWGPNWKYNMAWVKGSAQGFVADFDAQGNRFNPNKLLLDPYAAEISHDPVTPSMANGTIYASGPNHRLKESGRVAPKGIVLMPDATSVGTRPTRPLAEEIIYEVHLRGLTAQDESVPAEERGTYLGAARKADYLKDLGVTAVEFLPLHEFGNDQNADAHPGNDDYWGYATLSFFAPDRRYAKNKAPGGPTREFKEMVRAFHDRGIKVYLDVVYNHTGEGGVHDDGHEPETANILSWRGLDNRTYYELTKDGGFYYDNTGVHGNFNCADSVVRDQILDSLKYYSQALGVDGFRFDLCPVLGNTLDIQRSDGEGFIFDKMPGDNPLNRATRELPVRAAAGGAGVDLIAEPWNGSGGGGQQQGNFPAGWAEWNDRFRDCFRKSQNKLGFAQITPAEMATRFAGSRDLYQDDGRKPWHSINFVVAHDGPSLRDLYAFNNDGRNGWDQDGRKEQQRQAARNGFAFPLLSIGVPMFTGGDEMYRTQLGDDNPYNKDAAFNYLNWKDAVTHKKHLTFAKRVIAFRKAHPVFRPVDYLQGNDRDGNGLKDVTWYRDDAQEPDNNYWNAGDRHFLAYRLDCAEGPAADTARSIYVAYNGWRDTITIKLPGTASGRSWHRAGDTAEWMESESNFNASGDEERLASNKYEMKGRSVLVLIEK
jgi:isoamylase